jgi:hypothetical protein
MRFCSGQTKDYSAIAMACLRSKSYNAKYLTDGLIGLAELLRGERARDFMDDMDKVKKTDTEDTIRQKEK